MTSNTTRVVTFGVGSMGSGMTLHLASLPSYEVLAYDAWTPTLERFVDNYASTVPTSHPRQQDLIAKQRSVKSVEDLVNPFAGSPPDVVIFMVVNSDQVKDLLLSGPSPYAKTLPSTTTVLIMATCAPSAILEIDAAKSELCGGGGCRVVDAPVSGGPVKAAAGKLSIMLSEPEDMSLPYVPMLKDISGGGETLFMIPKLEGKTTSLGAGSMAKAVHQLLAGVHISSACEALTLAKNVGLDLECFYSLVVTAAGNSWMFQDRGRRTIDAMMSKDAAIKSRVPIFVKDLNIVIGEAKAGATPMAELALSKFERAVEMGMGGEDDSQLWKVFDDDFSHVVDVAEEPRHHLRLHNDLCRAFFVKFDIGDTTLAHKHACDSVYIFLCPDGANVNNHVQGTGCGKDFMEFGEVRYGEHCECPLVHKITSLEGPGGVVCVDAEILASPPKMGKPEVEEMSGHELVKLRKKVRVFKLALAPGQELDYQYSFFHLIVVAKNGKLQVNDSYTAEKKPGDMQFGEPAGFSTKVKNVGDSEFSWFIIQWREY